jgi:hypothetical protein
MLLPIYFKHPKMLKKFFSTKKNKLSLEEEKDLHLPYIKKLYRDRKAPVLLIVT